MSEGPYVDDINIGSDTVEETQALKEQVKEILGEGNFKLHKWHSNAAELEGDVVEDGECTYVKETLGIKPSKRQQQLRRFTSMGSRMLCCCLHSDKAG